MQAMTTHEGRSSKVTGKTAGQELYQAPIGQSRMSNSIQFCLDCTSHRCKQRDAVRLTQRVKSDARGVKTYSVGRRALGRRDDKKAPGRCYLVRQETAKDLNWKKVAFEVGAAAVCQTHSPRLSAYLRINHSQQKEKDNSYGSLSHACLKIPSREEEEEKGNPSMTPGIPHPSPNRTTRDYKRSSFGRLILNKRPFAKESFPQ